MEATEIQELVFLTLGSAAFPPNFGSLTTVDTDAPRSPNYPNPGNDGSLAQFVPTPTPNVTALGRCISYQAELSIGQSLVPHSRACCSRPCAILPHKSISPYR